MSLPLIFPGISERSVAAIRGAKARAYPDWLHLATPNPALIALVRSLAGRTPVALVTTAKVENATPILHRFGLAGAFDAEVFGNDVAVGKPAPDVYLRALELTGADAARSVAFEDSADGIAAARAAGVHVVKVAFFE